MFLGWKVDGKVQQDPPPEFWDRLNKALQKVAGIAFAEEDKDEDNQKAG